MSYRIYIDEAVFHDGGEYSEMVSSLYEQIYDLEDRLLQPEIRGSREEISMLLAADFVEFGVSGRTFDKLQVVEELPHSPAVPVIIKDFQVKVLSPDVVLATYRAVKTNESREEMRNSLRSSIWKFLDGRWQIVFHQGTRTINNIQLMKGKMI